MSDERVRLSYDAAVAMLPDGETVHTYLDGGLALIGADWDRQDVLDLIRDKGAELSGPAATEMHHGLVVMRSTGPVFIETKRT